MKKKYLIILCFLIILLLSGLFLFCNKKFYLEPKYYGKSNLIDIDLSRIEKLIEDKENFGVFVSQTMCVVSSDFQKVIEQFQKEKNLTFYNINFSLINDSSKFKNIKYYPSFIIFKNGKIVDYLEVNKNEHVEYYSSSLGFEKWFTKYVELK